MAPAAGHRLAGQGEWIQCLARQWPLQQRIGRHQRGHAGGRRTAHARAQGDALVDLDFESVLQPQRLAHGDQGGAGGIALGFQRQRERRATDRRHPHLRRIDSAHGDGVADPGQRMAEDVEAHRHVADRGRRKRAGLPLWLWRWLHLRDCGRLATDRAHSRAPCPAATRSTSANTPAAVTSGPAPGPCTISGFSQ